MHDFLIRPGRESDIDALLRVEARAVQLLEGHEVLALFAMHAMTRDDLATGMSDGIVQVATVDDDPVGFALVGEVDGHAHLMEMDVDPDHGRRGIGAALLEAACDEAARRGYAAMTLTTLRDIPWNAPFYNRREFSELDEAQWGNELRGIIERERMLGFPMRLRVVMQRRLSLHLSGEGTRGADEGVNAQD